MSNATEAERPTVTEEAERLLSYWQIHGDDAEVVQRWAVEDLLKFARMVLGSEHPANIWLETKEN